MQLILYILARFSEPSSYAGLAAVLTIFGVQLSDTLLGQLIQLLAALCAFIALFLKERGLVPGIVIVVGLGGNALTACQPLATGAEAVANACKALQPAVAAVPGQLVNASDSTKARATNAVAYFNSVCASDQAIAAVVAADPTGGNDTAIWIAALGTGLSASLPALAGLIH